MQLSQPILLSASLLLTFACSNSDSPKSKQQDKVAATAIVPIDAALTPLTKVHAGGMERFKEPGVYVDGKALGVLKFGELPVKLKPVWFEEKAAMAFKPGDTGPRFRMVKQRRYRFRDYFTAMGIDVAKISEMHIYGGNQRAAAVVISGDNLRSFDDFLFRFGGAIWGKPLPACPAKVGDGKCPDQIGSIAVYVDKTPPAREGGEFYFEDDKKIKGIPYLAEPVRGGVRVYLDGPLATTIKRNKLKASGIKARGENVYKLFDFLRAEGIDTDTLKEAWIIEYDRRVRKLSRAELVEVLFNAGAEGKGEILMGEDETPTQVLSLHTKPVLPEDLPVLLQDEIDHADG